MKRRPYDETDVPVVTSQSAIRALIMKNGGTGLALVSHANREGIEAYIDLAGQAYRVRIVMEVVNPRPGYRFEEKQKSAEERRVWRVLFFHLKDIFTCAEGGVIDLRTLLMPHIVTNDGRTIADHILPKLATVVESDPMPLLPSRSGR